MKKNKAKVQTTDVNVLIARAAWFETKAQLAKAAGDRKQASGLMLNASLNLRRALEAS